MSVTVQAAGSGDDGLVCLSVLHNHSMHGAQKRVEVMTFRITKLINRKTNSSHAFFPIFFFIRAAFCKVFV